MHIRAVFIVYRITFICSPLQFRLQFPGVKRHPSFADFAGGPSPIRCRKAKEAIDIVVDLNDYFNSNTGWDDNVDWNTTSIDDEEAQKAFDKVLEKNGIVYSPEKGAWVKRTIRAVQRQPKEESLKVKF